MNYIEHRKPHHVIIHMVAINKLIVDSFYRNTPNRPGLNQKTADSDTTGCADVNNQGKQ